MYIEENKIKNIVYLTNSVSVVMKKYFRKNEKKYFYFSIIQGKSVSLSLFKRKKWEDLMVDFNHNYIDYQISK